MLQNEPVAINGGIAVVLAVIAPLLAKYGIDQNGAAETLSLVGTVLAAVLSLWHIWRARSKVTPVVAVPPTPPAPPGVGAVPPPTGV